MSENLKTEQGIDALPMEQKERMEKSWKELETLITKSELPEGVSISKVEHIDSESLKKNVDEMHDFLMKAFKGNEMMDEMQMEIGIRHGIVDYYGARDGQGKLITLLVSSLVETKTSFSENELSIVVWYVANKEGYAGKSLAKEVGSAALADFLAKAQRELKPVKAIFGEAQMADDEEEDKEEREKQIKQERQREKMFNRYADMKRLYGRNKKGELFEVLYEAPPEDDSSKGDECHFMAKMLDGTSTMSKEEYMSLVRGIHGQYTRPEYFTPEYAAFEEGGSPEDYPQEKVEKYRQGYIKKVEKIQQKIEKKLKPAQGDLVLLSERGKRDAG